MGEAVTLTIDNHQAQSRQGALVLEAADAAGIYVPRLCHHPDLAPKPGTRADARVYRHGELHADCDSRDQTYGGCGLCAVEIEGQGPCLACATAVRDGMVVHTDTPALRELRRDNLARMLACHPHACLLCGHSDGCDREACTQGAAKQHRCCARFHDCEFRKVCRYVTIGNDVAQNAFMRIPVVETPQFTMDPNLCIGCARCVRACEKTRGKSVISLVHRHGRVHVGTVGPTHRESGCVFCGACVSVCPTGALMDKGLPWKRKADLKFTPVRLPPEPDIPLTEESIAGVPETSGVYQLLDDQRKVVCIRGAANIRMDLREQSKSVAKACHFRYEEHGMYTMRETEMLAAFLTKYGTLPEVNNEISDLY